MLQIAELLAIVALVGIVLGGIWKAWESFKENIAEPYVSAQIAADETKINAAEAGQKSAELERDNAKTDTAQCEALSKKQNDAIGVWQQLAVDSLKASKEAKDKASRAATDAAPRLAELTIKAAAAPKLQTCEKELAEVDKIETERLRQRRGLPPLPVPVPVPAK